MKPDKNFKLPQQVKRTMATMVNAVERNEYKNLMIQAEIAGSQVFEKKKKRNNETEAA